MLVSWIRERRRGLVHVTPQTIIIYPLSAPRSIVAFNQYHWSRRPKSTGELEFLKTIVNAGLQDLMRNQACER